MRIMTVWDWGFTWEIMPDLLDGLVVTLRATAVGITIALVFGLLLAVARRSRSPFLSWPAMGVIEFGRSTPLLVQLFFMFYVLPDITIPGLPDFEASVPWFGGVEVNDNGILLDAFATGALTLGIHYGTYTSEVYRAGIDNIERGQWEASTALSLSPFNTWTRIILPQAIPTVVPALGNYLIAMFKEVPLLATITVVELLGEARSDCARQYRCLEPYTMVGVIFLVISIPSSLLVRFVERRLGYARA
jgi:polar amino acid transport system permease protein